MNQPFRSGAVVSLALALGATIARAARPPNPFARAHWLLDYRFGFMKRALQGEVLVILSRLGVVHLQRATIFAVTYTVFALLSVAMLAIAVRTLARDGWSRATYAVFAAFVTSAYVVTSAHLMGYLDHVIALLSMVAVWLAMRGRYWPAGIAIGAAMLVHETVLLTGIPVLLMAIALRPGAPRGGALAAALAPMILPLTAGAAILLSEQNPAHRLALRAQLIKRLSVFRWVGEDMNIHVPEWVTTSFVQHAHEQAHHFPERITSPGFMFYIVPSMILLWLLSSALSGRRPGWMAAAAAAIALPLLLHLTAFDTAREWTLPLIVGLMCVWVASESGSGRAAWGPATRSFAGLAGLAIVLFNVFWMRYPLLDYLIDRFDNSTRALLYAPFFVTAALFVWRGRRRAPDLAAASGPRAAG
jgi:hypothetical protein